MPTPPNPAPTTPTLIWRLEPLALTSGSAISA